MWRIAGARLADVDGRRPTNAETAAYTDEMVDENRDRLVHPDDPSLIYPGQRFVEPAVGPPPPARTPTGGPDAPSPALPTATPDEPHVAPPAAPDPPPAAPRPGLARGATGRKVVRVRLPSGSTLGLTFAAGMLSMRALSALHRRRAYRPSEPRASRASGGAAAADEPISILAAAVRSDGSEVLTPGLVDGRTSGRPWADRRDPAPTRVAAGAGANGAVELDPLSGGGLSLDGPGAADVARCVIVSALLRCRPADLRVLIDAATASELVGLDHSFPGVDVLAAPDDVLREVEIERVRRRRVIDFAGCEDFGAYRADPSDEHLGAVLVVGRPGAGDRPRWAAVAASHGLGIGAVLLGASGLGLLELVLTEEATVESTSGAAEAGLTGAELHRLTKPDAISCFGEIESTRALAECPEPGLAIREEPFPVAAVGDTARLERQAPVRLRVLGPFALDAGGQRVQAGLLDKARELLAYLALRPDGVRREKLIEDLWGDVDPARRQDRFSAAVSNLRGRVRSALSRPGADVVLCEGDSYRLELDLFDVDLWRFLTAIEAARAAAAVGDSDRHAVHLRDALAACGGLFVENAPWEWVEADREALRRSAIDVAATLAELDARGGRLEAAISAVEHAIATVGADVEDLYVRGVELLVSAGRIESARALYGALRTALEDLDVEPMPTTADAVGRALSRGQRVIAARADALGAALDESASWS
jgi:DNA-binding SARP family transcriptional activator